MKNLYLFLSCFLITAAVLAQPSLQYPENAPIIGDIIEIQFVSPNGLSHLPVGPDVSWDYSQLTNMDAGTIVAIDPATAPSGNLFPTANIALMMDDSTFSFCLIESTEFNYLGAKLSFSGIPLVMVYSDPRKFLEYPFSYSDIFADSYKGVSSVLITEITADGESVVLADAYGTLILPTGTYHNVLRLSTIDVEIDSIFMNGTFINATLTNRAQFHWYAENSTAPLFSMEIVEAAGITDTVCFYSSSGAGIIEADSGPLSKLNIFPNPASDELVVEFTSNGKNEATILIVNQVGQIMISREVPQMARGLISEKIDISELPAGIYFASVLCNCGTQLTQKLVIR